MARSTGIHLVLPAALCFATNSLAAETGMLYAKSDPPGATVVIEGKERGKTPVLVRDLPAGEITVELRFPGVKPVTKQVTVEAKRVAKIDVHIELPSATLTIVSEPLEATVFMNNQEVGKTPLTLEDLAPGRHQLILLKDGHPRTARSVVLEPGAERVLEVKLGMAGVDETERPAPGKAATKPQQAAGVPVEVQLILTMLKEAVDKCNYADTRRNLVLALKQPDMAEFKEELLAAIRVVQALEVRQRHIRKGAEVLVGKDVTLKTRTGSRKGKVESVSVDGIAMAAKIIIDGRAVGETRATIKWSALAPEEQHRLAASWKPEGTDGSVARALLAQARRDKAAVKRALAAAGEHPLGKHLGKGGVAIGAAEPVDKAAREWERLERVCKAKRAGPVLREMVIMRFLREHGKTGLDAALGSGVEAALARARRASGLAAHWPFDERQGAVARDSSGNAKHGRISGAVRGEGRIGGALRFDGVGSHVVIPRVAQDDFTIAFWVRTTQTGGTGPWYRGMGLVDGEVAGYAKEFGTSLVGGKFAFGTVRLAGRSVTTLTSRTDINDGEWHHVAATRARRTGALAVYVNGRMEARGTGSTVSLTAPPRLTIGCIQTGMRYFRGDLDDVRIYNRALSAEEVKALATAVK